MWPHLVIWVLVGVVVLPKLWFDDGAPEYISVIILLVTYAAIGYGIWGLVRLATRGRKAPGPPKL